MKQLTVSRATEEKIQKGALLLESMDFPHLDLEDQSLHLVTGQGKSLGTAYLSPQNKGIGWLVSREQVNLDTAFFQQIFERAKQARQPYYQDDLTTAFRLFNQEGDGFGGLTIDLYGDYALFSWYNAYVFSIKDVIVATFQAVFPEIMGGL